MDTDQMETELPSPSYKPYTRWNLGTKENMPICAIVIGMAGSGKSTLMQRINSHVHTKKDPAYLINLDPAVATINYAPNIDIRDSVKYKEVMKQYNLGPNGGILTSLNLYATKFDQVMGFVEKRAPDMKYIFLDTPGQIEVFNWSASGVIITDAFATYYPTVIIYVVDTPQSAHPATFMSNMLYACSLFYKSKLPMIVVFTKIDIMNHKFLLNWMTDSDAFDMACRQNDNYMSSFVNSMALMIGEFYNNFQCVGVSSVTGEGMDDFFQALGNAGEEYFAGYKVELEQTILEKTKEEKVRQQRDIERLKADLEQNIKAGKK